MKKEIKKRVWVFIFSMTLFLNHSALAQTWWELGWESEEEYVIYQENDRRALQCEQDRMLFQMLERFAAEDRENCYYQCLASQGALCGGYDSLTQADIELSCAEQCGQP